MINVKRIIHDIEREREEKYIDNQSEGSFFFVFRICYDDTRKVYSFYKLSDKHKVWSMRDILYHEIRHAI
jgi:hypothetical protein